MSTVRLLAGYVGGVTCIVALVIYLQAILRGKASSNRTTWGVWIFVTAFLGIYYYQTVGFANTIWVSFSYFVGTLMVFIFLLLFTEKGQWTWVEKTAVVCLVITLVLYAMFHLQPIMALYLTMFVDLVGTIPLVQAVYNDPRTEHGPAWYLGLFANVINLLAVEKWDYPNAGYPIWLLLMTLTVSVLIRFPKLRFRTSSL